MALDPRSPFSSAHPLAGKISAGIRTTENAKSRAPRSHQSMELSEMPVITMADRAQQMFSLTDKKGTRVYYANGGVFNTVDEVGKSINFIRGLFKTSDRPVMRFIQQFVDQGLIHYLELEEDAQDVGTIKKLQRSDTGAGGDAGEQQHQPEPERRDEAGQDEQATRDGAGGEDSVNPEQPSGGTALSSGSGDGDDSPEPGRQDDTVGQAEPAVAPKVSLKERLKG